MPAKKTKKETEVKVSIPVEKVSLPQSQAPTVQPAEEKKGWFPKIDSALEMYSLLVKQNWKGLFIDGLKIGGLQLIVSAITLTLLGILAFTLFASIMQALEKGDITTVLSGIGPSIIIILTVFLPIALVSAAIQGILSFTMFPAVEERANGRIVDIFAKFKELAFPAIGYTLVVTIISIILLLPLIIGIISKEFAIICLFAIIGGAAFLIFAFSIQFAGWELTVGKAGVFESLKRSHALVKKNIGGTIVFDIILVVVSILISIPFSIPSILVSLLTMSTDWLPAFIIKQASSLIINFVFTGVTLALIMTLSYSYWKTLRQNTGN
ncbi:MAG: hypothetical protein AABW86_01920 [Candidatus Micrarchaeota archaeon]